MCARFRIPNSHRLSEYRIGFEDICFFVTLVANSLLRSEVSWQPHCVPWLDALHG